MYSGQKLVNVGNNRGLTLTELLIAAVIAGLLVVGLGNLMVAQVGVQSDTQSANDVQAQAQYAMHHLAKMTESALMLEVAIDADGNSMLIVHNFRPSAYPPGDDYPDPGLLDNRANIKTDLYQLESVSAGPVVLWYRSDVDVRVPPAYGRLPGFRQLPIVTGVDTFTVTQIEPNLVEVTLKVKDSVNGREYQLGPLQLQP